MKRQAWVGAGVAAVLFVAQRAEAACDVLGQIPVRATGAGQMAAVADLDGDGHPDIVALAADPPAVTVLLAGDRGHTAGPSIPVGPLPVSAITADLDGDGHLDLVVVDETCTPGSPCTAGSVSVLRGHGDGSFETAVTVATAPAPLQAVAADLNGDGKLDLAVAAEVSLVDTGAPGSISVLLGHGDGTFEPGVDLPAGQGVRDVAAGDLDGDGHVDLVALNDPSLGNHHVTLLRGNAAGTFEAGQDLETCLTPTALAIADLDGDGRDDLAVACASPATVGDFAGVLAVFQQSNGVLVRHDHDIGPGPGKVAVADLDGDGNRDVVVLGAFTAFSGLASTLLGTGEGDLGPPILSVLGNQGFAIALIDGNGDGRPDLFLDAGLGTADIATGDGAGGFGRPLQVVASGAPTALATGDVDGDGRPEIVLATTTCFTCPCDDGELATIRIRDDALEPGPAARQIPAPFSLALGDFDGDHHLDAAATGTCGPGIRVSRGRGDGRFDDATEIRADLAGTLAAGDLDGDGRSDLIVAGYGDSITLLLARDAGFADPVVVDVGPRADGVVVGDFDGDGKADLAIAETGTPQTFRDHGVVALLRGKGDGRFEDPVKVAIGSLRPLALAAGDFDGDGKKDLAVLVRLGEEFGGAILLRGGGDGTFTWLHPDVQVPLIAKEPASLEAADVDGDGKLDLVLGMRQSLAVRLLLGSGDGTFVAAGGYGPAGTGTILGAADLEATGRSDLAIGDSLDGVLLVFRDHCDAGTGGEGGSGGNGGAGPGGSGGSKPPPGGAPHRGCGCGSAGAPDALAALVCGLMLLGRREARSRGLRTPGSGGFRAPPAPESPLHGSAWPCSNRSP